MFYRLSVFIVLVITPQLLAMPMKNADLTLTPPPPPKPKILGIQFGSTPQEIVDFMGRHKVKVHKQKEGDIFGVTKVLTFLRIPPGIVIKEGRARFYFFKNELIKIRFDFEPAYRDFIILREQLISSLGDRFLVSQKQETMDPQLRHRLAALDPNSFNEQGEQLIRASILEGKTFYYYQIEDRNGELNITYAFNANHSKQTVVPSLTLHYELKSGIANIEKFQKEHGKQSGNSSLTPIIE